MCDVLSLIQAIVGTYIVCISLEKMGKTFTRILSLCGGMNPYIKKPWIYIMLKINRGIETDTIECRNLFCVWLQREGFFSREQWWAPSLKPAFLWICQNGDLDNDLEN